MSIDLGGSDELAALAAAIGLLDPSGQLDPGWFSEPLKRLAGAVKTPAQRQALTRFLDLALPPVAEPGRPAGERWHPLLGPPGNQSKGNLHLTVNDGGPTLVLGVAGEIHTTPGAAVPATLRVQGDIVSAGSALDLVVGTGAHPIVAELRVETGWVRNPPAQPIGLAAVTGRFAIVPDPDHPSVTMQLVLEGLSLSGEPPADTVLDVDQLGAHAPDLLAALAKVALAEAGPDPVLARLADHFLALFGLADAGAIPAFPFAGLGRTPGAVQAWMAGIVGAAGTPATAGPWLEHLAGLLGVDGAAAGAGTADDPWRVTVAAFAGGDVHVTVALVDNRLRVGLGAGLGGPLGVGQPTLRLEADAALLDVALAGTGAPVLVPRASVLVRATGHGGGPLLDTAPVRLGSLQAGLAWNGTALAPTLVVLDSRLDTVPYPRLDLTNVDSVEEAATDLVVAEITQALGTGAGRRLAALTGLLAPEDPANPGAALPGWAHHLDLTRFVVAPTAAIGAYHRAVLTDGANWRFLLRELAQLLGLGDPAASAGTAADPFAVTIAASGGATLQLAAWHQPAPAEPATEQLRLGLRLAAEPGGATLALVSELLTVDLPAAGPATVALLGAQQLQLVLQPAVDAHLGPVELTLDSLDATLGWSPGAGLGWQIRAGDLSLAVDGDRITAGALHLPPTVPFDLGDLPGSAAALGLSPADLVGLLRLVLVLLAEQAGPDVSLGAALLGLHRALPGLGEDSPLLIDPADPGLVLRDPIGAVRAFLGRLAAHVSPAGQPGLVALFQLLASLGTDLAGQLTGALTGEVNGFAADAAADLELALANRLGGTGTFEDPWRLPWPGSPQQPEGAPGGGDRAGAGPDLELWLEPAGPPVGWLGGLATRAGAAASPEELAVVLAELAWFDPALRSLVRGLTVADLVERLVRLQVHLGSGDGVVPRDSQGPDIFGWVHGIEADAAHHLLPTHPDVITEVLTRVEQVRGVGARTVVLVGPDFADHTIWADLLASPQRQGPTDPAALVDLRTPGIEPRTISLDGLTAVADWYPADLAPGDVTFQAAQLAHLADRLAVLHPGPLTIVAHSTAGLVARRFAADHPDRVAGLITIGTPHLGASLPFLSDPELGDAVRLAGTLAAHLPASPLADAVAHLLGAVEGYRPAPAPGGLDIADPYPAAAFAQPAPFDLGDIPVFTVAGGLAGDLLAALAQAVAAQAQALAGTPRPDPTHLGYGMAMPLPLASAPGAPTAVARARYGLGQIPLTAAPPAPPRPPRLLRVELDLAAETGWLVGGPGSSAVDGRLRRLQLGLTAVHGLSGGGGGGGRVQATVDARLDQAAWRGTTAPTAGLADPRATPLLGAAVAAALAGSQGLAPTNQGPAVTGLAAALSAIGLVATDGAGVTSLAADAFGALRADPVGYLAPRIPAALAAPDGWAGLIDQGGDGTWRFTPPGSPYDLFVRPDGPAPSATAWHTGIETTTDLDAPLWVGADIDLTLPAFTPEAELTAHLGPVTLRYHTADGTITADVEPWIHGLVVFPTPTPAQLGVQLNAALPDILATGVLGTVVGQIVPGLDLAALGDLLHGPGPFLGRLLATADGLDPARLTGLLGALNTAIGLPAGPGLQLPADLSLTAGPGATTGSVALAVTTTNPVGGVLSLQLGLDVDAHLHPTPTGTLTLETPLAGTWPRVAVTFGTGPGGVSLVVTPQGVEPITLLPTFSGLGALRGAAGALLPRVLDAAVGQAHVPHAAWLDHVLAAAGHLDLHDPVGGFSAHTPGFTAMLAGTWFDSVATGNRAGLAQAAVDLLTLVPGLPGTLDAPGTGLVRWTHGLPAGGGQLQLAAGWGLSGPTASLAVTGLQPADAPARLSASVSAGPAGIDLSLRAGADLGALGVTLAPSFSLDLSGGHLRARLLPLASGTGDGPLAVTLAPAFAVTAGPDTAVTLLEGALLPLAAQVALRAAQPVLAHHLWTGGPTLTAALTGAGVLDGGGTLAHPLPSVFHLLAGFLASAADALDLAVGDLHLSLVTDNGRVGVELKGRQAIPLGDLELDVLFGAPAAWGGHAGDGLQLLLVDISADPVRFDLGLRLRGVGVGLARSDGTPLVNETAVKLGAVRAYLFLDLETGSGHLVASHGGAGVELGGFGLPLSAALSSGGGSNPVASNLLASGGSGGSHGDAQAVNPAADIDAWWWDDAGSAPASLHVLVGGQTGLLWIPIQAGFGPIFINELGVGVSSTRLTLAIDGGVSVAGLSAEVDQLSVAVPFATAGDPGTWVLDLKGLAVGYSGPGIAIAGGLVKFDGPPVEYDGMLLIKIGTIGAIAIGSYGVVGSGADQFTSLAIFGGVFVPIGLPPIVNLTGFALGLGYNRRLIVPEDLNQVPEFMLVKALDRPEQLANNPMEALYAFHDQVPPARGALWFAAGVRGTSFEIVNLTAIVYVALNNGVEVGLLGVARLALPADDAAIVSVELALKARFSSAEGLFSVQAQLTDNSWLITSDCRLTGGFAFFTWFRESQFLLTLGGYHPSFVPRPEYPVVPRIGYQWNFLGVVHIKGETYFALTNTAIMAGVRVEATYGPDWIQVWFTAYADILVMRDPFHYEVDLGVSVGARLRIEVCFFACVHIEISVSVGASLHLAGPPFHGTVTADLGVTSVTVPFGDDARAKPPPRHWDEFVLQYVQAGDGNARSVQAQVSAGLLPPEPAGGPVAPGTADQPWRLAAEWSLRTETKMPARGFALQIDTPMAEGQIPSVVFGRIDKLAGVYDFDLAPMYVPHNGLGALHRVTLARQAEGTQLFQDMVPDSQPAPADGARVLRHALFRVTPVLAQVSEATYHYFPDLKPPAAANTLPVLSGLQIDGVAALHHQSQVVPIGTLVDSGNYRPLPFARRNPAAVARIRRIGAAWLALAGVADTVDDKALVAGAAGILGGDRAFGQLRAEAGARAGGYDPLALEALTTRRSAPPSLSALSEGFTLDDVGRGVGDPVVRIASVTGVALTRPRLRAVMQRPLVSAATAPAPRTTAPPIRRVPVPGRPPTEVPVPGRPPVRVPVPGAGDPVPVTPQPVAPPVIEVRADLVTRWDTPGVALLIGPAADTPQPTRAARSARSLRHPAQGGPTGRAAAARLDELAKAVADGVTLRSGVTHVWELPPAPAWTIGLTGDSAVRITELSAAGTVLADRELVVAPTAGGAERLIRTGPGIGMVAVTALGRPGPGVGATAGRAGERGGVTGRAAPGARAVLGWQTGGQAVQVGPTNLLARGAVIRLGVPSGPTVRAHTAASGIVAISAVMADQPLTGTELPASVTVVGVLVDNPTDAVPGPADVLIHLSGATAGSDLPTQVVSGRRSLYLYDVRPDRTGDTIVVAAGLTGAAHLAGVVGSTGTAAAWGAELAGSTLTQLVPDEHLTPDGALSVRLNRSDGDG